MLSLYQVPAVDVRLQSHVEVGMAHRPARGMQGTCMRQEVHQGKMCERRCAVWRAVSLMPAGDGAAGEGALLNR